MHRRPGPQAVGCFEQRRCRAKGLGNPYKI